MLEFGARPFFFEEERIYQILYVSFLDYHPPSPHQHDPQPHPPPAPFPHPPTTFFRCSPFLSHHTKHKTEKKDRKERQKRKTKKKDRKRKTEKERQQRTENSVDFWKRLFFDFYFNGFLIIFPHRNFVLWPHNMPISESGPPKVQPQKCNLLTWYMVAGGVGTRSRFLSCRIIHVDNHGVDT